MKFSESEKVALRAGVAVGVAVSTYGFSFGALSVASGLTIWQTCVLSLFLFSGGSQFAVVGVLASGGVAAGWTAIASSAFLGLRNGIYSIRMAPIVATASWLKPLAAQLTIDESTAVALNQAEVRSQRVGFWTTGIAVFVGWNLTTLAGALVGNVLGDVDGLGLDAVAAAAFLGLLWPRLKQLQAGVVAAASAVLATILIPFAPPGVPVLAAAAVALVIGLTNAFRRREAGVEHPQPDDRSDPGEVPGLSTEEADS